MKLADKVLRKVFGKEETIAELSALDEELKQFIEDARRLEEDWHEKVKHVREFLQTWDKGDFRKLKEHIRIIRKVEGVEKNRISKDDIILGRLYKQDPQKAHSHPSRKYAEKMRGYTQIINVPIVDKTNIVGILDK